MGVCRMVARERSEPNSEPPYGGGSVVARCVSAGYPDGELLEPRLRGGRKPWLGGIVFIEKQSFMYALIRQQKTIPFTRSLPPLNRGSNTVFTQNPTLTRRATELSPLDGALKFRSLRSH